MIIMTHIEKLEEILHAAVSLACAETWFAQTPEERALERVLTKTGFIAPIQESQNPFEVKDA